MTRYKFTFALLGFLSSGVSASGWNDFNVDIGQGFEISKTSALQVCIGKTNGALLVCPFKGDEFGPVSGYAFTKDNLLVKTYGAMPHPKAPEILTSDKEKDFYFLINKRSYEVIGPITSDQFYSRLEVPAQVVWERPENPNILGPVFGTLLFLVIAALVFGWPLIVVLFILWMLLVFRKKHKAKRNTIA